MNLSSIQVVTLELYKMLFARWNILECHSHHEQGAEGRCTLVVLWLLSCHLTWPCWGLPYRPLDVLTSIFNARRGLCKPLGC